MEFPSNPIKFLDGIVYRQKEWLARRRSAGESLRYMGENVDQQGRGIDFLRHYVYNDAARRPDPTDPDTDLALLQLYEHWRERHHLRPIESWDGTRLRPWLPSEANPSVPQALQNDLQHFNHAYYRGRPWSSPLDALGNAIEAYLDAIRRHHVWSRPSSGGTLRLYRFNELNNIEVAPYSIRFWGFLRFADDLRRIYLKESLPEYAHDELSDISFMDNFNQNHFPWHDDVTEAGKCPSWYGQYGLRKHYKYERHTQGYAVEFLEFHSDLLTSYNKWLREVGMPPTSGWREDGLPFSVGVHDSSYILKYAFSGNGNFKNPWGRGGTDGKAIDPTSWASALFDPQLTRFQTAAELGHYLEFLTVRGIGLHGAGHVERCDIRDQYLNNYSLRFFHWHQWIDDHYQRIKALGRPYFKENTNPEDEMGAISDITPEVEPPFELPLNGTWTYRSYSLESDVNNDPKWFAAKLTLEQEETGEVSGTLVGYGRNGELNYSYSYSISGKLDHRNLSYRHSPEWWDDRAIIVLRAVGETENTEGHVYEYRGWLQPQWPDGKEQVDAFVGTVCRLKRPDNQSLEGKTGSFIAVKRS